MRAAVRSGEMDAARLASYRKLVREAAAEERRTDPLARKAYQNLWKSRVKALRGSDRKRR